VKIYRLLFNVNLNYEQGFHQEVVVDKQVNYTHYYFNHPSFS